MTLVAVDISLQIPKNFGTQRAFVHPGDSWEWPKYVTYQSENCQK